jgi:hypothetical protein
MSLINLASIYNERPSKILNIDDSYVAYCVDQAVTILIQAIKEAEGDIDLRFKDREKQSGNKYLMSLMPEKK